MIIWLLSGNPLCIICNVNAFVIIKTPYRRLNNVYPDYILFAITTTRFCVSNVRPASCEILIGNLFSPSIKRDHSVTVLATIRCKSFRCGEIPLGVIGVIIPSYSAVSPHRVVIRCDPVAH